LPFSVPSVAPAFSAASESAGAGLRLDPLITITPLGAVVIRGPGAGSGFFGSDGDCANPIVSSAHNNARGIAIRG
jgi:hypothetical protein